MRPGVADDGAVVTAFRNPAPPAPVGRVMGLLALAANGVFPLSVLPAGAVAPAVDPAPSVPSSAAAVALALLAVFAPGGRRGFARPGHRPGRPRSPLPARTRDPRLHRRDLDRPPPTEPSGPGDPEVVR